MNIEDNRYEGTWSCLHGENIFETCSFCGRTQKDIDEYYEYINNQYERFGM